MHISSEHDRCYNDNPYDQSMTSFYQWIFLFPSCEIKCTCIFNKIFDVESLVFEFRSQNFNVIKWIFNDKEV